MQRLQQAAAAGYFEKPKIAEELRSSTAFSSIRNRPDFEMLLQSLDLKSK